jgi:hypothetical protein
LEEYVPKQALTLPTKVIMKAKVQLKILEITKESEFKNGSTVLTNMIKLKVVATNGRVDTTGINAQVIGFIGEIFLKEAIANNMKIGATITVAMSDEEQVIE